jgi:hypothetical protein
MLLLALLFFLELCYKKLLILLQLDSQKQKHSSNEVVELLNVDS